MTTPNISEAARKAVIEATRKELEQVILMENREHPYGYFFQSLLDSTQAENVAEIERLKAERNALEKAFNDIGKAVGPVTLEAASIVMSSAERMVAAITALRARAESAERERDFLKSEWEKDSPLPEDEEISMAHPVTTGNHEAYQEAMRFVGARHSKAGLVELVNWLLVNCSRLIQERANIEFQPTRKEGEQKLCEQESESKTTADVPLVDIGHSTESSASIATTEDSTPAASPGPTPADAALPKEIVELLSNTPKLTADDLEQLRVAGEEHARDPEVIAELADAAMPEDAEDLLSATPKVTSEDLARLAAYAPPRTDVEARLGQTGFWVLTMFAETLERELTAERAARLKAEEENEKLIQQEQLVADALPNEFEGSEETFGSMVSSLVAERDQLRAELESIKAERLKG